MIPRDPDRSLVDDSGRGPDRGSHSGRKENVFVAVQTSVLVALFGVGIGAPALPGSHQTAIALKVAPKIALKVGCAAAGPQAADGCQTLKDLSPAVLEQLEPGKILVELKNRPEQRTKEGLVLRRVEASLGAVAGILKDHERLPDLVSTVRSAEVIHRDGQALDDRTLEEESIHVRQVLDLPFPLRNRRYTIEISATASHGCFESSWRYVEGSGNIRSSVGRWEVLEQGAEAVLIAYIIHTDPGGFVPGWAADWASKRALPDVVESISAAAEAEARAAYP